MKTHSKDELEIMAAQAKVLAQGMVVDPRSRNMFTALAKRLEQEAAELGKKLTLRSASTRSAGKGRQS